MLYFHEFLFNICAVWQGAIFEVFAGICFYVFFKPPSHTLALPLALRKSKEKKTVTNTCSSYLHFTASVFVFCVDDLQDRFTHINTLEFPGWGQINGFIS